MKTLSIIILSLIVGLAAGFLLTVQTSQAQTPSTTEQLVIPFQKVQPKENPMDRIPEKAITVYKDRIVLDIQNAQWSTFTDTHSMEPVIFQGANALQLVPKSEDEIKVGDIVSYKSEYTDGTIIHRVVYKGEDEQGTYFVMKGDNLPTSDPGRIRFSQIQRVVVAIVY